MQAKENFSKMSCEDIAKELSGYAMVDLNPQDIADMDFGAIAKMAPIHELAVFKHQTKEALKIYGLFHCNCAEKYLPPNLNNNCKSK